MRCPTAPSLPWVAWASLPHLHRYYAPLRLPPCPSRVASLGARFPIPGLLPLRSWCPLRARGRVKAAQSRQGLWSPGPPIGDRRKEADGSPKFPSYPSECMPRSSGRNTARATLGREFPTCTFAVCAAGSSFRHRSRVRKPPSPPGRSACPRPVGSQRSACVISAQPSHLDRGLRARPPTPLSRMVSCAGSPRLR
jgi:hypothetical protein